LQYNALQEMKLDNTSTDVHVKCLTTGYRP